MDGKNVAVRAADGKTFDVYIVGDAQPAKPAIIVFSPIFGIDDDIKSVADRWAARGYLVAVPDYYFRVKSGVLDRSDDGRKQAMQRWKELDVNLAIADMESLKNYLVTLPGCNRTLLSLGICAGGEMAFLAGTRLGAEAVATFHATHIDRHLDEAAKLSGPLTLHYGGSDPLVPIEKVDAIRAQFSNNADVDIHVYGGAEHGFSFVGRPSYHEVAATSSDRRAEEVFARFKPAA
jgi:carboxymethylenebutenolidase